MLAGRYLSAAVCVGFTQIYKTSFAYANAKTPTRLLRTTDATAIANFETDTARKKHKKQWEVAIAIAKATGLFNQKPLNRER